METKKLKGTNILMNEDFLRETKKIMKRVGTCQNTKKQGKFATLIYNRIYTREKKQTPLIVF